MLQKNLLILLLLGACSGGALRACPQCRPQVQSGIYNQGFAANMFVLLLPVAIILAIGVVVYFVDALRVKLRQGVQRWQRTFNAAR